MAAKKCFLFFVLHCHTMNKIYSHKFYLADINDFSEIMKKDVFEIDGRTYYWMSMSELESDQNVLKKNSDIINYVKESF